MSYLKITITLSERRQWNSACYKLRVSLMIFQEVEDICERAGETIDSLHLSGCYSYHCQQLNDAETRHVAMTICLCCVVLLTYFYCMPEIFFITVAMYGGNW